MLRTKLYTLPSARWILLPGWLTALHMAPSGEFSCLGTSRLGLRSFFVRFSQVYAKISKSLVFWSWCKELLHIKQRQTGVPLVLLQTEPGCCKTEEAQNVRLAWLRSHRRRP